MSRTTTVQSKKRRILVRLLAMAMGLAMGLVAAELFLRAAGVSYPAPYAPDAYCGTRLQPGFHGYWSKEGAADIRANAAGFRDVAHTLAKPPKTIRIAVLGDSFIEAFQVPLAKMFSRVLERDLNRIPMAADRRVEVLSFGISGWGTANELMALRHHVWQYDPDIVLLAFFPGNDVYNNSRALASWTCRPFFVLQDGNLVPDMRFHDDPVFVRARSTLTAWKTSLINASRVIQVLQTLRQHYTDTVEIHARHAADDAARGKHTAAVGRDNICFMPPPNAAWQEAWNITDRLIEQFQNEVTARGKLFVLMPVTCSIQVYPDKAMRERRAREIGVTDLLYPNRHLRALAAARGFPVISIVDALRRYADANHKFLHGFPGRSLGNGHWNEAGHRLAAEICARQLAKLWQQRNGVRRPQS